MPNDQNTADAGLIPAETAARLLMLEPRDFERIVRSGAIAAEPNGRFRVVAVVQGYLRHLESERHADVTGTALAAHLFCTRETMNDYAARGIIEKLPSGRYDLNACRERVMRHLRDRAAGRSGDTGDNLASARAELAKEQREAIALKNAEARGDLVLLEDVIQEVDGANAITRERLLVIPGKMADALHQAESREEVETLLREEVHDALSELSHLGHARGDDAADQA